MKIRGIENRKVNDNEIKSYISRINKVFENSFDNDVVIEFDKIDGIDFYPTGSIDIIYGDWNITIYDNGEMKRTFKGWNEWVNGKNEW